MKIHVTKEWCEQSADIEGNSEIGAGCPPPDCSVVFSRSIYTAQWVNKGQRLQCLPRESRELAIADIDCWRQNGMSGDFSIREETVIRTLVHSDSPNDQ